MQTSTAKADTGYAQRVRSIIAPWRVSYIVSTILVLANIFGVGVALGNLDLGLRYLSLTFWVPLAPLIVPLVLAIPNARRRQRRTSRLIGRLACFW